MNTLKNINIGNENGQEINFEQWQIQNFLDELKWNRGVTSLIDLH